MIDLVENRRTELAAICRRYRLKTLELFGSTCKSRWLHSPAELAAPTHPDSCAGEPKIAIIPES